MTPLQTRSPTERVPPRPAPGAAPAARALLVFHLAGQAYGLPVCDVQEVVPMARLSRPPDLPAVLAGFLNLAGTAVPVLRLDRLFGLPEQRLGLYTPLIVLRLPESRLALLVEAVSRIVPAPPDAFAVPDNHSFNDCVTAVATVDGEVVLLLSAERLLLDKEQQCLAELQDREQARLRELEGPKP
jgi:purine-binding chemotaxis protein CheW